jgi:hypothetical protein
MIGATDSLDRRAAMLNRPRLAAAAIAAALSAPALTPALAADYAPSPACAPPADYLAAPVLADTFHAWNRRADRPRMVYVERYDPRYPPAAPTPARNTQPGPSYIAPQTAYLASDLCDFAYGQPRRSWYDGKLFYWPDGIGGGPDSFMVIERD